MLHLRLIVTALLLLENIVQHTSRITFM